MKKRVLFALMLTGALALSLLLVTVAGASPTLTPLDSVNIGDTGSEAGHNLKDWTTKIWSGCTWCGPDGNMRLIWGDGGETCAPENNWASVDLNAGSNWAQTLSMEHLDGAGDDGFNVFVNGDLVGTYVATPETPNVWYTDDYEISSGFYTGVLTIKFQATGDAWPLCGTYGQIAFNLIELYGGPVPATIDINPDTLNLKSKGSFITAYIELPPGFDVADIDVGLITLDGVPAELSPTAIGDYDADGVPDLMVKFDRNDVQATLEPGESVEVTITGQVNGTDFEGTDTIRVIEKGKDHTSSNASSVVY